jgi:hypothetical protein
MNATQRRSDRSADPLSLVGKEALEMPKVYLVSILDGSGEATFVDSAWSLRGLAEARLGKCQKEYAGLECWIDELALNPEGKA